MPGVIKSNCEVHHPYSKLAVKRRGGEEPMTWTSTEWATSLPKAQEFAKTVALRDGSVTTISEQVVGEIGDFTANKRIFVSSWDFENVAVD